MITHFKAVYPIADEDTNALPVKDLGPAIAFYETVLGFSLVRSDSTTAVLKRDEVQIGLIRKKDHDPLQAGSCYFDVADVEALRRELEGNGAKPGAIEIQEHGGKNYRLFFVRECDMMESHDGYCFCFGQPGAPEGHSCNDSVWAGRMAFMTRTIANKLVATVLEVIDLGALYPGSVLKGRIGLDVRVEQGSLSIGKKLRLFGPGCEDEVDLISIEMLSSPDDLDVVRVHISKPKAVAIPIGKVEGWSIAEQ